MVQTSLMLVGASAVIATAIIFVCRPVLIAAVDAMRNLDLPIARAVFIGLWALAAVLAILCIVATAAVRLHSDVSAPMSEKQALQEGLGTGNDPVGRVR